VDYVYPFRVYRIYSVLHITISPLVLKLDFANTLLYRCNVYEVKIAHNLPTTHRK